MPTAPGAGAPPARLGGAHCAARAWRRAASRIALAAWRGLYGWWGRDGLVPSNPAAAVRAPRSRPPKPLPSALAVEQAVALADLEPDHGRPELLARDQAVVELLYGCGLRIGELLGLDLAAGPQAAGWVDLADATAHVLGKGSKRRSLPVGAPALAALQQWLLARPALAAPGEAALFVSQRGTRLTPNQLRNRLRSRAVQAGVPTHVHPHMLRHSFASHLLQSPAATCARCRSCWATPASAPPRSTRGWISSTWPRPTTRPIRGRGGSDDMKSIRLRDGKERSLLRRHPWVFQGSVASGKADPGETVRIDAADGSFLAWGAYSPTSMIRVRAWSFDAAERIDRAFFQRRIAAALALRQRLPIRSDGVRLVHGEADGLPGLIVDRYGDTLSAQFLSAGTERWRDRRWPSCCWPPAARRACTSAAIRACARSKGCSRAAAGCAAMATRSSPSASTTGS